MRAFYGQPGHLIGQYCVCKGEPWQAGGAQPERAEWAGALKPALPSNYCQRDGLPLVDLPLRGRMPVVRRWPRGISAFLSSLFVCLSFLVVSCGDAGDDDDATSSTATPETQDYLGPTIIFSPPLDEVPPGLEVPLSATIEDESGVSEATLYYRAVGTDYWGSSPMVVGELNKYSATIPSAYVTLEGVDYYLTARDASSNRNLSKAPKEGASSPYRLRPSQAAAPFPLSFSFDPPQPTEDWRLEDTGWYEYVGGFNDGENWTLRAKDDSMADFSAYHDHGSPYLSDPFEDHLLSPPLDLSNASSVDLYWVEWLSYSEDASHRLMVSVGSPDPEDGEYVTVLDPLEPSSGAEGAFVRSQHVDLSAYAGESRVTLAFVYEGLWGDDWALDDVVLEVPRPDLVVDEFTFSPSVASPGESLEVQAEGRNVGLVGASDFVAALSSEDGLVTVEDASLPLEEVAAGDVFQLPPFTVMLDETHPNDVFVPLLLELSDGVSRFSAASRIQVGRPPVAHIEIFHEFADDLQVFLGVGAVEAPDVLITVQQDEGQDASGTFAWDVDLSSYGEFLPPDLSSRWFLQVYDDSPGNTGEIKEFDIRIGEDAYEAQGLPASIPDDGTSSYVFLPGRAQWTVETLETDPSPLTPGAVASLTLSLLNGAAPPLEPVYGSLEALSDGVTVLTEGPVSFAYTTTSDGVGRLAPRVPFDLEVAESHVDSSSIALLLHLEDEIDSWDVPLSLPVPYPVLEGVVLTWEETPGTPVGIPGALEAGEVGAFRIRVRNIGGMDTFGAVTARLSVPGSQDVTVSEAPVVVAADGDTSSEGQPIPAGGEGKSALISASVSSELKQSTVTVSLELADTVLRSEVGRTLTFGEVPWNPVFPVPDPKGDAHAYPLDLYEGDFRVMGTVLEQRFVAHTPFDGSELFFYSFVSTSRNYQYALAFVYGEGRIYQWYVSGSSSYWYRRYTVPSSYLVEQIDAVTLHLSIDLASLGMATGNYYGGASAGACDGNEACDYAPDEALSSGGLTRFYW